MKKWLIRLPIVLALVAGWVLWLMWLAGELEPSSPSTAAVGCEPQPPGEVLEPLLGRAEAQLRLLGARRVAVQVVVDDIACAAVELVCGERDAHVGASRPRFRDRDLALGGEPLRKPPERLARHVARPLELDRHAGDQERVGRDALEDVALLAADHEAPPARAHRRPEGRGVGGGGLLGNGKRHALLAPRDRRQPVAFLRRRAERGERQAARDGGEDPERRDEAAALLDEQPEVEERRALAAELARQTVAEPPEAGDRLPEGGVVPLGRRVPRSPALARDLRSKEATRRRLHRLLVGRRPEVHAYLRGSPRPRWAMMQRWISLVPPPKRCIGAVV